MNDNTIKNVTLTVNGQQAKETLGKLEKELEILRRKRAEAFEKVDIKGMSIYDKEIKKVERSIDKMRSTAQNVESVLRNMDKATPKELETTIRRINKELNSGSVERGSAQWDSCQKAIRTCKEELEKLRKEQKVLTADEKSIAAWGKKWVGAYMIITNSIQSAMSAMQGYVDDFARMDDAMTQTKKYTGMTRQEVEELNEEFKKIDTATPREKLNALAADAGRLGIQSKDAVLEFVQAADLINIALGEDLGEDAVKNIGKLAQLFGDADSMGLKQAMLSTASTINELAQSSSASEGYIMNFTSRLAGVGKQAGMSQAQVMAFASVLDQNMVGCERGATALQNVIMKLYKEPEKMAKAAGMDVQKFTKLLQTDGNAALLQFIETLSKAGKIDALAPMFADMKVSGSGISQTLTTLASNIDTLRQTQEQATVAFRDGTSAEKEAASQRESAAYKLEKYKKEAHELSVELGSKLFPIFTAGMRTINGVAQAITWLISIFTQYATTVIALTGVIAAYTIAVKAEVLAEKARIAIKKLQVLWNEKIKESLNKLYTTIISNPYAAAAALVAVLAAALFDLNRNTKEVDAATRNLQEVEKAAAESVADETRRLKELLAVAKNEKLSREQRQRAIEQIKKEYPQYLSQLSLETINTDKATRAIQRQINAMLTRNKVQKGLEKIAALDAKIGGNIDVSENKGWFGREWDKLKYNIADAADWLNVFFDSYWLRQVSGNIHYGFKEEADIIRGNLINERNALAKQVEDWMKEMENNGDDVVSPGSGAGFAGGGSTSDKKGSYNDKTEKEHREKLKQLETEAKDLDRKLQETIQSYNLAFTKGELDVDTYRTKVMKAEQDTAVKQRDLYDKNLDWQVEKWKERNDKILQMTQKHAQSIQAWTIAALEKNEQQELQVLEEKHSQGLISETAYQIERNAITLKYLRQREKYYRKWGRVEDYDKAQLAVEKEVARQRIELLKKVADTQKKVRDEYLSKHPIEQAKEELRIQKEIMNALLEQFKNDTDKQKEIAETWNKIIAQIEVRLKKLKKTEGSRVLSEAGYQSPSTGSAGDVADGMISAAKIYENYEETKNKLFRQLSEREINPEEYSLAMEELEKGKYERIAGYATACYQTVSGAMQAASQLMQANYEIEAQKVEERYAREIAAAGEGTDKAKQLEARKQKELANLKNKYNKKAMAVEMAQAVAQTAVAAINAYASASKVAFWLGPVAAAAATAAGAIQIAAIAKQHEAQSAGYYEGGFTGGQNYRREAGVVHEGEFVANHQAVKNPNLLPVLNMIDQAQRHNRVASLTAADVNRVAGGTAVAAAPQPVIIDSSSLRTAESIEKLNRVLEHPIKTYVVIDGPDGLHRNYQEYKKIIGEE